MAQSLELLWVIGHVGEGDQSRENPLYRLPVFNRHRLIRDPLQVNEIALHATLCFR
jgi:hypothetical protein